MTAPLAPGGKENAAGAIYSVGYYISPQDDFGAIGELPSGVLRRPNLLHIGSGTSIVDGPLRIAPSTLGLPILNRQLLAVAPADFPAAHWRWGNATGAPGVFVPRVISRNSGGAGTGVWAAETVGVLEADAAGDVGVVLDGRTEAAGLVNADVLRIANRGISLWSVTGAGHLLASADNVADIGATGANRPRRGYFSAAVQIEADGAAGVTSGLCLTNQTLGAGGAATGSVSVNVNGVRRNILFN